MQIFVKFLYGPINTITLVVEPYFTVQMFRFLICQRVGDPPCIRYRFLIGGTQLDDETRTLSDYKVKDCNTVQVLLRLGGRGINYIRSLSFTVQLPRGTVSTSTCQCCNFLDQIKEQLSMVVENPRLKYNNVIIPQDSTATAPQLGLKSGDVLVLDVSRQIIFNEKDIQTTSHLGVGAYRSVEKGCVTSAPELGEVAVKKVHTIIQSAQNIENFQKELQLWVELSHPNIVKCYGSCDITKHQIVISELMKCSLSQFLSFLSRKDNVPVSAIGPAGGLSIFLIKYILSEIADGIEALHLNGIIHRDLNLGNILIGAMGEVKIGDFRQSRVSASAMSLGPGAPAFASPQAFTETYTNATDIWSFAIISACLLKGDFLVIENCPVKQLTTKMEDMIKELDDEVDICEARNLLPLGAILYQTLAYRCVSLSLSKKYFGVDYHSEIKMCLRISERERVSNFNIPGSYCSLSGRTRLNFRVKLPTDALTESGGCLTEKLVFSKSYLKDVVNSYW